MKRIVTLIVLSVLTVILVSCNNAGSPLVISKLYTTDYQENNVIELYNTSTEAVDLKGYSIKIYSNGSNEATSTIELNGTIDANGYFIIGGNNHYEQEVKNQFDFTYTTGDLPFNGNDAIQLAKGKKGIDLVGSIGLDSMFSYSLTLIRTGLVEEFTPSNEYSDTKFIGYLPNVYQYLGNSYYEIKTLEDIYNGPRLEERYLSLPYANPNRPTMGAGGVVTSILQSISDGDTAFFRASGGFTGGSMRYFYINTPEVNGSNVNAQPWGYVASKFNKEYLLNDASNKTIQLQSIPGYSLTEGYGRSLGLVWINGQLSQFLIAAEGLTNVPLNYESYDLQLSYKDVPYVTFLKLAESRAKANGWGIHGFPSKQDGEKSPDWNYAANNGVGSLATTTPVWQPHFIPDFTK